jgi:uncharacterized protein YciI
LFFSLLGEGLMFHHSKFLEQVARDLFLKLAQNQPSGAYQLAGCAKDGSEGPPPKTPPPPPPGIEDFREAIEQVVRDIFRGELLVRVSPGAGILGIQRMPMQFVSAGTCLSVKPTNRIFMITYERRGHLEESEIPDLILEHALFLRRLSDANCLEASARYASGEKGMHIILADSKAEVEKIAESDPLFVKGYYQGFDVQELLISVVGDC